MRDEEEWLMDSSIVCCYDGETIQYSDPVVAVFMVRPFIVDGHLVFQDIMTEDNDDYLYEPLFFHTKNWDEIEEQFEREHPSRPTVQALGGILRCRYCSSDVLTGETTCVVTYGEIHKSQRDPDGEGCDDKFENMDTNPIIVCTACAMDINDDVHELWDGGVSYGNECKEGTYARCWRSGCPGNCGKEEG